MNFFALSVMHKSVIPDIHFSFIGGDTSADDNGDNDKQPESIIISESIYSYLCKSKETIETCNPDEWDSMKKYTNPYEFIHTAIPGQKCAISKLKPLSRSFYKMIEIIKHCKLVPYQQQPQQSQPQQSQPQQSPSYPPIRTFHLAEGPGGFIEAVLYVRGNSSDAYHGMTLVDDRSAGCPGWNKSRSFLERNPNVFIEYGADGTGDLLSLNNYDACCAKYGRQMEFISADGGFDFSSDFNNQEVLAQNLIVAEVLYAISLQKYEGSFVLKIFDIFTKATVDLLQLLCSVYDDVIIFKPSTSRIANSEKYVVCKRFNVSDENTRNALVTKFRNFFIGIAGGGGGGDDDDDSATSAANSASTRMGVLSILRAPRHNVHLLTRIEEINVMLGQQQIENIANTVSLIQFKLYDRLESYKRANVQKCISWCEKYNIPYNKGVVSTNTFIRS